MIRFTTSSGQSVSLAGDKLDGDGGTLLGEGLAPVVEGQVQEVMPFRATNAVRFARGNLRARLTFSVWTKHSTLAEAIRHSQAEPGLRVNQRGSLTYTDQVSSTTYGNAIIQAVTPASRVGNSTVLTYTVLCDPPS